MAPYTVNIEKIKESINTYQPMDKDIVNNEDAIKEIQQSYRIVNGKLYYHNNSGDYIFVSKNVDKSTFSPLYRSLAIDKNYIYNGIITYSRQNLQTLKFYNDNLYVVEGENLYVMLDSLIPVEAVDVDAFIPYSGNNWEYYYAKDKDKIYYLWEPVQSVDYNTFVVLNGSFGQDSVNVFCRWILQWNVDYNTFEIVNGEWRDKNWEINNLCNRE